MHVVRKRFGQHFLHDPGVVNQIIAAIGPKRADAVVEIGPGRGALTEALLANLDELTVVEIDRDLIPDLERQFGSSGKLHIYNADALRFDFGSLAGDDRKLRIVGNLPYNISTPLIFRLLDQLSSILDMHFMLQKEVVERLTAAPGRKTYGRLSVMVQSRCLTERLFSIGPGAFSPPPRVDSAFVRLVPRADLTAGVDDWQQFAAVVRHAFGQRRKTLANALKGLLSAGDIAAVGVDPGTRAEQLSPEDFARLSNRLSGQ